MTSRLKKILALPLALLLVLGLISPSFLTSQSVTAAAAPLEWKFNMADPAGSTEGMEGWTHIYPTSPAYSAEIGYGIINPTGLQSRDRKQTDYTPLENQFILGATAFRVDIPDGNYYVTVYSGDLAGSGTTNLNIAVDGESKGRVSAKTAVNSLSFEYEATKGYLQLDFSNHLYLNGITITQILPEIPEAPASLQAEAGKTAISLEWAASITEGITYSVYRSLSGENNYTVVASGITNTYYADTTAVFGSSYDYYVIAVKGSEGSEATNIVTSQLLPAVWEWKFNMAHPGASTEGMEGWIHIYPTSPAYSEAIGYGIVDTNGLSSRDRNQAGFTPLENQFILNAAAFRADIPDGNYRVTVYSGDLAGSGTTNLNIAVDGVSKGRVSVKAGVSSLSFDYEATKGYIQLDFSTHLYLNGIVITEILPEIPEAPAALQATANSTAISLSWEASATENATYTIYRSISGENNYSAIATGLAALVYQDTTAQFGSSYNYYVSAVKDGFESEASNVVTAELQAITEAPQAPASLAVRNVSNSGITLQWASSELTDSYNVYRSASATGTYELIASGITQVTYLDNTAVTSAVNYYKVTAVNAIGESAASPVAESIIYTPPGPLPSSFPYRFDIGLEQAADGTIKVDENAIYSEDAGYGFAANDTVTWGSNNDTDPLRNDFAVPTADAVFKVDLPNGDYRVTIISGDSATASQTGVIAERIQKVQIPEAAATGYMERTFDIALVDGQLNLSFNGSTPKINAITIDKLAARLPGSQPTVYIAGDSTVQTYDEYWKPEAGWGQMINRYFTHDVLFDNHAIGGRSSKTFITEGRLDTVLRMIRPGDYFLIQFGHNDATISVPERYASVPDYKEYLKTHINGARQRGAEPILVTPVGRRSYNAEAGKFNVSFPEYVQGMKEVATELNVKLVDLSALSIAFYDEIGFEATRSVFLHTDPGIYTAFPNGSADDTHFQEYGAIQLARLVAGAMSELELPISQYVIASEAPATVPSAPTDVVVGSISNAGATVSWTAVDGADIYKVYRKQASESAFTLVTTSTSPLAGMTGMADGTEYVVYVTAVNAKGESEASAAVNFYTKSADYKFDFQGGPTIGGSNQAGTDAEGYTVVYLGNSEANSIAYTAERGYGLVYNAGMITRNRGYGNYANELPTNVLDALRDWIAYFNVGWQFKVDVPNGIYAIKLYVGDFSGSARTNLAVNGINYGAVNAANSSYTERVINNIQVTNGQLLFNFTGSTAIANALEITTILVAPDNLHLNNASLDVENPAITLEWDATSGIEKYRVYRQIEGSSVRQLVAEPVATTWTDEDVVVGASYIYSVSAVDPGGIESVRSSELVVDLFDAGNGTIAAPENLTVTETNKNDVTITWDAVAGAHAYAIYRSESVDGAYELVGFTNEASYTDATVLTTIPYYFKVKALHTGTPSGLSDAVETPAVTTLLRQMEALDRGLVAINTDEGVFVSWRMLGTDPSSIAFHLYRDGQRITDTPIANSTNYLDEEGSLTSVYAVAAVIDHAEQPAYDQATVWEQQYSDIPLNKPEDGTTPLGDPYTYSANDASVADLDGDGEYEVIVKWYPSNAKDNSQAGYTGNVYIDAYELNGEQLWRIDLGRNIRAGAHYTQFMVYDLDGDGKAEVAMKTSDGTIDGLGNVIGDRTKDYRNSSGYVIIGNEFLTVFDGLTGAAIDTVDYDPPRGVVADWGDGYGNRVDRFAAGIAYLDGEHPSLIMARGVYTRIGIAAYTFSNGKLTQQWKFDTIDEGNGSYEGQGYHSLSIADVDSDGKDEVIYGQMVVDDNGRGLYSTGLGHGDALHVSDFVPSRPGLEIFAVQEHTDAPYGYDLRDARTGEIIWGVHTGIDTGRGLIADVDPRYQGAEFWAIDGEWNSRTGGLHSSATGERISTSIPTSNFAIWWDGDLLRELVDHDYNSAIGAGTGVIDKWNYETSSLDRLLTANGALSNNSTKGTPSLQADLLGDWREEVLWRTEDSSALRLYTTTDITEQRIYTLMHDPQYRLAIAWQNVAYNQPPHPSFFIGEGMATPPQPNIYLNQVAVNSIAVQGSKDVLNTGEQLQFTATVLPAAAANKQVQWNVTALDGSPTALATISAEGLLTAVGAGQVKVTASSTDSTNLTDEFTVTINAMLVPVSDITVNAEHDEIVVDDTLQLSAAVAPVDASNKQVQWSVTALDGSATTLATISEQGLLTAVGAGQVKAVASAADGSNVTGEFTITINAKPVSVASITVSGDNDEIVVDDTLQLSAAVAPANASNKQVQWSVTALDGSATTLATISNQGLLTAVGAGQVKAVASAADGSNVTGEFTITINAKPVPVDSITISSDNDEIVVDDTLQLSAAVAPANASNKQVQWSVTALDGSATTLATISNQGLLTAVGAGQVKAVASAADGSNVTGEFTITINAKPVPVDSITISSDNDEIVVDDTLQLSAAVAPANASNKQVQWSVTALDGSATTLATISNQGLVTAVGSGQVKAVASAADGSNVTGEFTITINAKPVPVASITISSDNDEIVVDDTLQLSAAVAPANASNKQVQWSVTALDGSATTLATISEQGLMTAVGAGQVKAVASAADGSNTKGEFTITINAKPVPVASITVSGDSNEIVVDDTLQLSAAVAPANASNKQVQWSVTALDGSATTLAIISNQGLLTAVSAGQVKAVASAADGSNTKGEFTITINAKPVPVASITIESNSNEVVAGSTLQLSAAVAPANASNKQVQWSVTALDGSATTLATISNQGLLTAVASGQVKVTASSTDGSNAADEVTITINNSNSGSTDNPAPTPQPTTPAPSTGQPVVIETKNDENGIAQATITPELLNQLAAANRTVIIKLPDDAGKQLVLSLSPEAVAQWAKLNGSLIEFATSLGNIKLSAAFVQNQQTNGNLEVLLENKPASSSAANATGSATTLQLTVLRNGEQVEQLAGGITVTLPQKAEERSAEGQWIVYLVNEDGSLMPVKNSRLNADNELVFKARENGQYIAAFVTASFPDVSTKAPWASEAVAALAARGIITGYTDGSFQPERQITRAEFIKLLLESADLIAPNAQSSFTDVSTDAWYYAAVASAQQLGLVSGKNNGQFYGNDNITREEMAVIAHRLTQLLQLAPAAKATDPFADEEQISSYAKTSVNAMLHSGILQGNDANRFNPQQNASRGEAAVIIYRLWQLFE